MHSFKKSLSSQKLLEKRLQLFFIGCHLKLFLKGFESTFGLLLFVPRTHFSTDGDDFGCQGADLNESLAWHFSGYEFLMCQHTISDRGTVL